MPTNRRRKTRGRRPDLNNWHVEFLQYGELMPESALDANPFELLNWQHPTSHHDREAIRRTWSACAPFILPAWIRKPGSRPWAWWAYDAPEPRRRVGGEGVSMADALNMRPTFRFGVPDFWKRIAQGDPPLYESEAAYLRRHELLSPAERKRLKPEDYEPETVRLSDQPDEVNNEN